MSRGHTSSLIGMTNSLISVEISEFGLWRQYPVSRQVWRQRISERCSRSAGGENSENLLQKGTTDCRKLMFLLTKPWVRPLYMAWDYYGFDSQNNESIPLARRFITPELTHDFTPCYVTHDCEAHLLGCTIASKVTAARGFD
jgi:hypothetical protein